MGSWWPGKGVLLASQKEKMRLWSTPLGQVDLNSHGHLGSENQLRGPAGWTEVQWDLAGH